MESFPRASEEGSNGSMWVELRSQGRLGPVNLEQSRMSDSSLRALGNQGTGWEMAGGWTGQG